MIESPRGKIVKAWVEFGHHFQIELLETPVLKGSGWRTHRLWHNGEPCSGGQWNYSQECAEKHAEYVTHSYYADRVRWLENRVYALESELYAKKKEHTEVSNTVVLWSL